MAAAIRGAVTPQIARATMQAASAADVTDQLARVVAPTLVLHRRGMPQIPADVPASLASDLPRGRLVMLEGTQPSLFMEDPGGVVRLLLGFLGDGIEPAGTAAARQGEAPSIVAPAAPGTAGRVAGQDPPHGDHAPRPGGLTRRELEVLRLLASGESNAQIARALGLSTHTIERHVANLYRKIGARGRADATAYAVRGGLA